MEKKILKAAKKYFNNYPVEDNKKGGQINV